MKDKTPLIRTPESWARDWGWISNRRAKNMAARLDYIADGVDGAFKMAEDEGATCESAAYWVKELRAVAKRLGKEAPAARRNRLAKAAAMREP